MSASTSIGHISEATLVQLLVYVSSLSMKYEQIKSFQKLKTKAHAHTQLDLNILM